MDRGKVIRLVFLALFCAMVFGFMKLSPWGFTLVETESVGFRAAVTGPADRFGQGDFVLFRYDMDDPQGKGLKRGDILVKQVTCDQGQVLEIRNGRQVYCDGKPGQTLNQVDSKGVKVLPFLFNGQVPEGMMFVTGKHRNSYDSRYWGFAKRSWVVSKVVLPLF